MIFFGTVIAKQLLEVASNDREEFRSIKQDMLPEYITSSFITVKAMNVEAGIMKSMDDN